MRWCSGVVFKKNKESLSELKPKSEEGRPIITGLSALSREAQTVSLPQAVPIAR